MMTFPLNDDSEFPRLTFEFGFDETEAVEAHDRGFRSHVVIEFSDGKRFPLFFYDPVTLKQEVEDGVAWGFPCVAEPGMVVVPEITLANMKLAAARLIAGNYFAHLKPLSDDVRGRDALPAVQP